MPKNLVEKFIDENIPVLIQEEILHALDTESVCESVYLLEYVSDSILCKVLKAFENYRYNNYFTETQRQDITQKAFESYAIFISEKMIRKGIADVLKILKEV